MAAKRCFFAVFGFFVLCGYACGQSPGVLYTWNGTGDTAEWLAASPNNTQTASLTNTTPGQLTVQELGLVDTINGVEIHGGPLLISDSYNRLRDSSTVIGGLDVTGLSYLEMDVSHTGPGPIDVQLYTQVGQGSTFIAWNQNDLSMQPNVNYTLQFPLSILTAQQKAYVRTIGIQARNHESVGDVAWTVSEVRSVGTPLTVRDLATHDVGSSDNGFNGVLANFDNNAIVGNTGGQDQSGMSINPSGSGSLQWTDKGNHGVTTDPSGAAVSWGNGTVFGGNSFFERPVDVSNYNRVLYRMSATDVTPGGGGSIGVQSFFQTGSSYNYQVPGAPQLPVDGQFHDLILPLGSISDRQNVQQFGVNLGAHPNDLVINVDLVQFQFVLTIPADYNSNNSVDAADYVAWRKARGLSFYQLDNEVANTTPGLVTEEDYAAWRARFGNSGGGAGAFGSAVPEPASISLLLLAFCGCIRFKRS